MTSFVSCTDFLDPWPFGAIDNKTLWTYPQRVEGLVNRGYQYINAYSGTNSYRNYNDNEGAYLDGATDNAVITSTTHIMRRYALNSMVTSQDPFLTYWDRAYTVIHLCNMFLEDNRGFHTRYMLDAELDSLVRWRIQGEAFAMRAFFEWDLLQKFGGKGINGEMLGFPITLKPISLSDEINFARNSYDECVKQIIADCDSAYKYLPIAHRDFLIAKDRFAAYSGGKYWGRFDGITTKAIKAVVYLTWASPRFNPNNDLSRWDSAAYNAKQVIDFKLTVDKTSSPYSFRETDPVNWFNPNSPEIIFGTRYNTNNSDMERLFYPGGFQSNGAIGATQELIDAFGDKNGYPIDHPLSIYDPTKPYENRDPRFYSVIFYNGAEAKRYNTGSAMYTFENWKSSDGLTISKDVAETSSRNSRTNYHIKKFVYMGYNPSDKKVVRGVHSKFIFRWTHMVLTFAEAANHVVSAPSEQLYGLSPKEAMAYIRNRATYDNVIPEFRDADPYLDEVSAAGRDKFDEFIKNERRIETCFEGMRFYDLRRWTTDADWQTVINKPVHGVEIIKTDDGTYSYNFNYEVEDRAFTSPYNPIPYNEMLRMSNLVQNEGWNAWN